MSFFGVMKALCNVMGCPDKIKKFENWIKSVLCVGSQTTFNK